MEIGRWPLKKGEKRTSILKKKDRGLARGKGRGWRIPQNLLQAQKKKDVHKYLKEGEMHHDAGGKGTQSMGRKEIRKLVFLQKKRRRKPLRRGDAVRNWGSIGRLTEIG